jgi:hypothetical protein
MAIVDKQSLLDRITGLGSDDVIISLLEDISDTIDSMETNDKTEEIEALQSKVTELEAQVQQVEANWRERYINRFKGVEASEETKEETTEEVNEETITIDDLFKKEGE